MKERRSVRPKRVLSRLSLGALCLVLHASAASAHTTAEVEEVCPLDGTKFTALEDMSGTSFGKRLDLRAIGPTASPWSLPVCPKDHFVLFKQKFSPEELADLRGIVNSEPYQTVAADHSSYFLLARILAHQKKAPGIVAFAYLQASWQVEADPVKYRDYAQRSLSSYREALLASKDHGEAWKTAQLLAGELERRLGLFAEATTRFMQLAKQEEFQGGLFKKIVAYQLELTRQHDSKPHEIPHEEH